MKPTCKLSTLSETFLFSMCNFDFLFKCLKEALVAGVIVGLKIFTNNFRAAENPNV